MVRRMIFYTNDRIDTDNTQFTNYSEAAPRGRFNFPLSRRHTYARIAPFYARQISREYSVSGFTTGTSLACECNAQILPRFTCHKLNIPAPVC